MVTAVGVALSVRYKIESAWGVAAGASGGQILRRTNSGVELAKQTYRSNEISSTYQLSDERHGVRSVGGPIVGELSPGTYNDFVAAAVRRAFTNVADITGASITIGGAGPTWTVTRAAGSFLTDGVKIGHVVRLTAGAFDAANLNNNFLVIALTATVATVLVVNDAALVTEGPIGSATVEVSGGYTYAPATGHTDVSFNIEHFQSDLGETELFLGCKINRLALDFPPTGNSTVTVDMMGADMTPFSGASAPYLTAPTAETSTGVLAGVNGKLIFDGVAVANVTSLQFAIEGNMTAEAVVGSNTYPQIFQGRVLVSGQLSAFWEDVTFRDAFVNETEVSLVAAFSTGSAGNADFVSITLPRIKLGGAGKDDGEKGRVQTIPFTALYNSAGGAGIATEQTTIMWQDSQA